VPRVHLLLHSNGDLQDSAVALVIDVRNMWEVSLESFHNNNDEGAEHVAMKT
jgi:hypothetical protein